MANMTPELDLLIEIDRLSIANYFNKEKGVDVTETNNSTESPKKPGSNTMLNNLIGLNDSARSDNGSFNKITSLKFTDESSTALLDELKNLNTSQQQLGSNRAPMSAKTTSSTKSLSKKKPRFQIFLIHSV
jgi:hypothetical protein